MSNRHNFTGHPRIATTEVAFVFALLPVCLAPLMASAQQVRRQPARSSQAGRQSTVNRSKARKPSRLQVSRINDPNIAEPVGPSSGGEAVVRASVLLDRVKFSPGEITKAYTFNLSSAISAFQRANDLPATGNVDPATWTKLNQAQATGTPFGPAPSTQSQTGNSAQSPQPSPVVQAITTYVITLEDVNGPFTKLPKMIRGPGAGEKLMQQEAKLHEINYESPLELLAEKCHSSPRLLVELNPGKAFDKAGTAIYVPNVLTSDPAQAASLVVDASTKSVTALDPAGKIVAFYPATIGSEHDPLPAGNWQIAEITRYPHFHYNPNLFWDADDKHAKATLAPGANNPVGVVWIGLSKEHYGIHGTPEPSKIGVTQSHGCVRLTNWDALELSKIVHIGTPAVLRL